MQKKRHNAQPVYDTHDRKPQYNLQADKLYDRVLYQFTKTWINTCQFNAKGLKQINERSNTEAYSSGNNKKGRERNTHIVARRGE